MHSLFLSFFARLIIHIPSPMYVASLLLLCGYGGIRFLFTNARPAPSNDGAGLVFALALCCLATGMASCAGMVSAVNAVVKVFPARMVRFVSSLSSALFSYRNSFLVLSFLMIGA